MIYFHYGDENWYRAPSLDVLENNVPVPGSIEVALELLSDGRGMYRICKSMRMKQNNFCRLPEDMTMIALSARSIE